MFMNVAGLKMFLPSTPYDMKGLLKTAIRDNNPVISFESSRLMGRKGPVPEEDYTIPFGEADVKREGSDVTVVALAWLVHEALAAAEELAKEGISVEIVDPRTLVPLDTETIRNSVQKTGRLVIADEAGPTAGFSAEIAAVATEDAATFARLKAPVKRVCALQVPIPYSPILENHVFPDRNRIIAGIREVLAGAEVRHGGVRRQASRCPLRSSSPTASPASGRRGRRRGRRQRLAWRHLCRLSRGEAACRRGDLQRRRRRPRPRRDRRARLPARNSASPPRPSAMTRRGSATAPT